MLVYEYKLDGTQQQYAAIDEAIRIVQFIRNKCLRKWIDERGVTRNDLQCYCAVLAQDYSFAARLNSQARQAAADRAWAAIARFYENCKNKTPGKKGYPQFQHDNRSIEYKQTGWRIEPDGRHLTFTDGCSIGCLRLVGNKKQSVETFPVQQMKRVRIIRRADGYYCQFVVQAERKVEHISTGQAVGIDVGLKSYYTDSDGTTAENPRYLRKAEKRLKRLHRRLSRTQKKSANRKKARKQLAKAHLKVQRQREDFARKTANAQPPSLQIDQRCFVGHVFAVGQLLRNGACYSCDCRASTVHHTGLFSVWHARQKEPFRSDAHLPYLWTGP